MIAVCWSVVLMWPLRSVAVADKDHQRPGPRHRWEYLFGYVSFGRLADGVGGGLRAAAKAELGEDARHMVFGGAAADHQAIGDVGVREAVGEQRQDLGLALGEGPVGPGPGAPACAQLAQEGRGDVGVPVRAQPL